MKFRHLTYLLLLLAVAIVANSCIYDRLDMDVPYVEGHKTRILLRVEVPDMNIATRGDMPTGKDAQLNSLWVGIFNANSGKLTYSDFPKINYPNENHGEFVTLQISTVSGPSYIVAVGNPVDNRGYFVDNGEGKDLAKLLKEVEDWETYKKIVVRQLAVGDVSTPTDNLIMSGIYYDNESDHKSDPKSAAEWEDLNTKSVPIPVSGDNKVIKLPGAVHLRRLISQVKFHFEVADYYDANEFEEIYPNPDQVPSADRERPEDATPVDRNKSKIGRRIIEIIPQSFQVFNAPYTSWLHERKSGDADGLTNSGDAIRVQGNQSIDYSADPKLPLKANYRRSASFNGSQYFKPTKVEEVEVPGPEGSGNLTVERTVGYDFDFWMLENKRWAVGGRDLEYTDREKEQKSNEDNATKGSNTGIYTALCGDGDETMNNSAAYVKFYCRVVYTDDGLDAIQDEFEYKEVQYRSAEAVYVIHMGGIDNDWSDFTHRRNHKYTYNIKVVDIDRIIVEAKAEPNSEKRPDIEGVVTDVVNPPFDVDCHNAVCNILLTNRERTGGRDADGNPIYPNRKFPWRIKVFDGQENVIYIDQDTFVDFLDDPKKRYWQWIELRPAIDEFTIAEYKPHDYNWDLDPDAAAMGKTFYLTEVADITNFPGYNKAAGKLDENKFRADDDEEPNDDDLSDETRWYTVFIKEYAYEYDVTSEDYGDETGDNWIDYVGKPARMCWFNTRFYGSKDMDSNYIRSKYVIRQPSIQTFYDATGFSRGESMNAIGMEHINETFGFNLRWGGVTTHYDEYPYDGDNSNPSHDIKNNNGRHNTLLYLAGKPGTDSNNQRDGSYQNYKEKILWEKYLDPTKLQMVEGINTFSNQYGVSYQLYETPYLIGNDRYENYKQYSTQDRMKMGVEPYYVTSANTYENGNDGEFNMSISNINTTYYLRILDACMNRNRDDNGNGVIDIEEIRWYVPASSEIVDLVNGRRSLDTPLMDYSLNKALNSPPENNIQTEMPHQANTRFHYATSNQRTLWAEEGASINPEIDFAKKNDGDASKWDWNLPPQNLRCVRALGTDLRTDLNADLTPAFTVDNEKNPTQIYPTYFESKNLRAPSPNLGIDSHQEYTEPNRLGYGGFEFDRKLYEFETTVIQDWVEGGHYKDYNPGWYADGDKNKYLGPDAPDDPEWAAKNPKWKDAWHSGEEHPGGHYGPDPNKTADTWGGELQYFDSFSVGGVTYPAGHYWPDPTSGPQKSKLDEGYEYFEEFGDEWHGPSNYSFNVDNYSSTEVWGWVELNDFWYNNRNYPKGWYEPNFSGGGGYNAYVQQGFWTGTRHGAGYYSRDLNGQITDWDQNAWQLPPFPSFSEMNIGGTTYPAGYYGPNSDDSGNTNNPWFQPFYDDTNPAGYYADNGEGEYLGTEKPVNQKWIDDNNAVYIEEAWREWIPEGGYQDRVFGNWYGPDKPEDQFPEPLHVFVMPFIREGYSSRLDRETFAKDHGLTLEQANKVCVKQHNGQTGWRLPNMKEAALIKVAMERAGMYKTKVFNKKGDNNEWDDPYWEKETLRDGYEIGNFLTCTFRQFGVLDGNTTEDDTGYYTGVYYPECEGEASPSDFYGENNEYLMGRVACITTEWNRHFYIRCVRDLPDSK